MNEYDKKEFFEAYAQMPRSINGLEAAGEWHQLKTLFPPLFGKRVLDMGCGYGWHSKYAADNGAAAVTAIDMSEKMLKEARKRNCDEKINYICCDLREFECEPESFDFIISNLVLHYVEDLDKVYKKVFKALGRDGVFLFNIEHPCFTAGINEDWIYDEEGRKKYWPIDGYYYPGKRETVFLGHRIEKQHHTLTQILNGLLQAGFSLENVIEAMPPDEMMHISGMTDELRRPMMLLVRAKKHG